MATSNFPTAFDEFLDPSSATKMNATSYTGSGIIGVIHAALRAIQTRIGVANSTDPTSIEFRLNNLSPSTVYPLVVTDEAVSGDVTFTVGVSNQITKFKPQGDGLTSERTLTISDSNAVPGSAFEFSFVECKFNNYRFIVVVNGETHVYDTQTYVKYMFIEGNWERVI